MAERSAAKQMRKFMPEAFMNKDDRRAADAGVIIWNPVTAAPHFTLAEAQGLMQAYGVSCLPVIDQDNSKLVGILTQRDIRFATHSDQPIQELMTRDRLITARDDITVKEAQRLIHQFRIERLLIVDDTYRLKGLLTHGDLRKLESASVLEDDIRRSARGAPIFVPIMDRISYRPKPDTPYVVAERLQIANERCVDLLEICEVRSNEQPELFKVSRDYSKALKSIKEGNGSYRLFVAGLLFEEIINTKSSHEASTDRNIPLDADLLLAVRSLLIAHAGLISVLEDLRSLPEEFSFYRDQLSALRTISETKPFKPILLELANTNGLLDENTRDITKQLADLSVGATDQQDISRGEIAAEQSWLRGALAAIGGFVVGKVRYLQSKAKDTLTTEAMKGLIYNYSPLASAAYIFIEASKSALLKLASAIPEVFGYLRSLLALMGL